MATGDEDYSGDYTDSGESDYGDDISRYSPEFQDIIRDNARARINGKLLGDDGKNKAGFGKFGQKKDEDTGKKKWGLLNKGEEDASKAPNKNGKGGDKNASLAEKENNVEADDQSAVGKYKNAVKGVEDIKKGRFASGAGRLKKAGPIFAVLAICLGFGGAGFLGQMSMTSSFMAQIQETFDSTLIPQQLRSKVFLRYQTSKTGKKCIKAHYLRDDEFKISKRMANKFTKQGIDIVEEGGVKVMKYTGDDGSTRTVVADRNQAGNGKVYIDDAIDNDPSFRKKYNMSTAPWRTSVALWFDSGVQRVLSFFNIKSRNSHKDYDADSSDAKEKLRNTLTDSAEQDSVGAKVKSTEVEDETKVVSTESGTEEKTTPKRPSTETEGTITKADASQPATMKSKLKGVLDGAISKSSMLVNFYCAVADGIGVITAIVAAAQTIQIVNMASSIFEGIQKAQAGEGDSSPIHEIGNALTERTENTYTEATAFKDDYEVDESKNKTVTRTRSAMESNGVASLYSREPADYNDASVKSLNPNTVTTEMWGALSNSSGVLGAIEDKIAQAGASIKISSSAFKSCTIARISAAWANLAITVGTIVKDVAECFGTGPGCLFVVLKDSFKKVAEEAAKAGLKSLLISIITNFATKKITELFKRSVIQKAVGEDLGNVLVSGGNAYMGMNHRQNGGSVADKDSLVSYYQAQDRVIAENARYERESRSPFDITSKYTFMGSIAAQLVPMASSMTSITSAINGASGVIGSAISSLSPKSSAVSAGIRAQADADATAKANPYLADLGGVGDAFGNPYIITDTKTLGNHPADIVNDVDALSHGSSGEKKNLLDVDDPSAENVPKIGKNSDLAKYIVYCGQRQSPFGMADQNIATEIDKTDVDGGETKVGQGAAAFANGALSAVPVLGDTLDITSNQTKLDNLGWISGESCVTNNKAKYEKSIDWDEAKKYQRFIEDQRLAEAEGLIEKSAVTEYLAEYYEEHPLDNSLEGVLARYSGYTKENVAYALNLMDVMNFVAEYDPTNLYPYPRQEQPEQQIEIENQYDYYNNDMLAMHSVVYNDLRYRNHAA